MKLTFLGASKTVTGSKTLVSFKTQSILVDCGLYQGKDSEKMNRQDLGVDPRELAAIFLTHGHLDHCGYLPLLVKKGFSGKIISTYPTREIVRVILEDSAGIQENESRKKGGEEPLYDGLDVERTMELFVCRELNEDYREKEFSYRFYEAGHILGAASIVFDDGENKLCFSGDLGRAQDLIHRAPDFPKQMDALVLESTYGNREHPQVDPEEEFRKHINRVRKTKGVLLIPSFAVARSQIALHILGRLFKKQPELRIPVYFDSPMGTRATRLYRENAHLLKISKKEFEQDLENVKFMEFGKDLKRLAKASGPHILISSSGMISGGRVLKHFDKLANEDRNTVLLLGYQGEGTIGRALAEGEKTVPLFGHDVKVRAQTAMIESLSAHADHSEILGMLQACEKPPQKIFLNHGEEEALTAFQKELQEKLRAETLIAQPGESHEI